MIQVCSRCGTRWNVRDRQRAWCPRCHGALMAPTNQPDPRLGPPPYFPPGPPMPPAAVPRPPQPIPPGAPGPGVPGPGVPRRSHQLPPGFRWIAVRPGPPPPRRNQRRPLGPTPRYSSIPRWGLFDDIAPSPDGEAQAARKGPSAATVRAVMLSSVALFGAAAFVHVIRYILLLINRTTLLPRLVANMASLLSVVTSVAAVVAVIVTGVATTWWLIGRRSAVFQHLGGDDPRPLWTLWAGSLVPLVNLVWAPVFVIELARAENSYSRMRGPIAVWWVGWLFSYALSIFAFATSFTTEPQGVADNTVSMILAYLLGGAVTVMLWKVFDGFVRKPVERPLHRWVVIGAPPAAVEPEQREPAA